ncbi:MAG: hypothetical protein ACO38I_03930 [Ilumatobacteraceae bacterium]
MLSIDGVISGSTSFAVTVFSTFAATLYATNNMITLAAAVVATFLGNGTSDALSVSWALKDEEGNTIGDPKLAGVIFTTELLMAVPMIGLIIFLGVLQQKGRVPMFPSRSFKLRLLIGMLAYVVASLFIATTQVGEEGSWTSAIRVLLVLLIVLLSSVLSGLLSRGLARLTF